MSMLLCPRPGTKALDSVDSTVALLKRVATKPGAVPAPVVLDAMLSLEKAKLPVRCSSTGPQDVRAHTARTCCCNALCPHMRPVHHRHALQTEGWAEALSMPGVHWRLIFTSGETCVAHCSAPHHLQLALPH
jgi:hypothetical protein